MCIFDVESDGIIHFYIYTGYFFTFLGCLNHHGKYKTAYTFFVSADRSKIMHHWIARQTIQNSDAFQIVCIIKTGDCLGGHKPSLNPYPTLSGLNIRFESSEQHISNISCSDCVL